MERRILNREELLKVLRLMLTKLFLSLMSAFALSLIIWYLLPLNSLWFTFILIPVLIFVLFVVFFYFLGKDLFLDFYHQEKVLEHKSIQKLSEKLSKEMDIPIAARCTQKQSFGVSTENSPKENEVIIDNEKLVLPKQLFERLKNGDKITLHKAFYSGVLFKVDLKKD